MDTDKIYQQVQDCYGEYAKRSTDADFDVAHTQKVAQAFGYSVDELQSIPQGANLGASCGNPLAIAGLAKVNPHLRSVCNMIYRHVKNRADAVINRERQ